MYQSSELSWIRLIKVLPIVRAKLKKESHVIGRQRIDALQRIARLWKYHCDFDYSLNGTTQERGAMQDPNNEDIVGMVGEFWNYGCANPRDRIFALCSMTSDIRPVPDSYVDEFGPHVSVPIFMEIDYSVGVQQTYKVFATACVYASRFPAILKAVLARQQSHTPSDWPSWVPDWRHQPTTAISIPLTSVNRVRHVSEARIEIYVQSPRYWTAKWGLDMRLVYYYVDSISSSSRATAERMLSYMTELYRTSELVDDKITPKGHITPSGLATVVKAWSLMRDVDLDLLVNCLTRLWDDPTLRNSNFLVQYDKRLARQLQEALRGQSFFSIGTPMSSFSNTPEHTFTMYGFGNAKIQSGDRVIPTWKDYNYKYVVGQSVELNDALIIRPQRQTTEGETIYRLIGSACLFDGYLAQPAGSVFVKVLLE
jgi:hypothetical protein